jgi:hypothetical protein
MSPGQIRRAVPTLLARLDPHEAALTREEAQRRDTTVTIAHYPDGMWS